MKTSMLRKTVAALTIGAAFPLGAIASQPAKTMIERGVIEKVNATRKEFALKGGHLKRTATFEWNASTRFLENGKPAAASELKTGERARAPAPAGAYHTAATNKLRVPQAAWNTLRIGPVVGQLRAEGHRSMTPP